MEYDKYIFLDYENIQDINLDIIDEKVKMVIIIDKNEIKMPVDLLKKVQPFGNSIEWIQIENNENKNALYFFLVYFLVYYIFKQGVINKEFIIYSKNKDFDPLIEYLQNKNINLKRIVNLTQNNENTKNSLLKNMFKYISVLWCKLILIQKIIFIGLFFAVIGSFVMLNTLTHTQTLVPVINFPIMDKAVLDRIVQRIYHEEGVKVTVTGNGIVQVSDEATAQHMRVILIMENLIPSGINSWDIFDKERWTATDLERNVNFRKAQVQMIADHIKAIDDANVVVVPETRNFFRADQKPITARVIITPKAGSDIHTNRKKIEGIQKILKYAVVGLKDENIVIVDPYGFILNNNE